MDAEHEADKKRRILIDDLNRTFITPIERDDDTVNVVLDIIVKTT